VPWAREGSRFTLLFEQVAITLVREMPVLAAARIIGITDQRLWRIVEHYVGKAVERLDLTRVKAIGLDETAAKRGQTYVTVFIDLDRKHKPVVFVTPGRGKDTVARFKTFLAEHGGSPNHIVEVVCDMSGAFLAAVGRLRGRCRHRRLVPRRADVHQGRRRSPPRRSQAQRLPKALRWAI
jgi:transposase